MKTFIKIICLLLAANTFTACEKVIDYDLQESEKKIVIDANIVKDKNINTVSITKSAYFNESNTFKVINNALVIVSDNENNIDTLTYEGDGKYQTSKIIGKEGNTYKLYVKVNNQVFESNCTMPKQVNFDSLYIQDFGGFAGYVPVPARLDPKGVPNYYRFKVSKNKKPFSNIFVQDDELIDGNKVTQPLIGVDYDFKNGDSCQVEMLCISKEVCRYWFELSQNSGGGPGGGTAAPSNPTSNIIGGCLGYFSAHTSEIKSIIFIK
jgi:hypothetical protein